MKRKLFIFALLIFSQVILFGQVPKYQAMFIYNFSQNIEWPASYKTGDFVISVLGNSPIISELETLSKSYKVGNQKMVVEKVKSPDKIVKCNILFIPQNRSADIGEVMSNTKDANTLIITEKDGFAQAGAAINFVQKSGQLKFELNMANAKKKGLGVSKYLQNLAIMVE